MVQDEIREIYAKNNDLPLPDVNGNPLRAYIEWLENVCFIRKKEIIFLQKELLERNNKKITL